MLQTKHINVNHRLGGKLGSKLGFLALLGLFTSIGLGTINSHPTHALTCDENSMVSCIDIAFGDIVGSTDLQAPSSTSTSHGIDRAYFYLPVSLTVVKANDYSITVYSQNGGELRSKDGNIIPTLSGEAAKGTSLTDLGKDGSVWGYRYNLGDTASDPTKSYIKVPSQNDPESSIISNEQITATSGTTSKVLTLGFATAVDGNLPAGDYSDKIIVAITATPKQTSAFGLISTMQEMTPEICASATTPRVDAELPDSTGIHHGDDRYVPEATLTDTRDGKTYLIRKLADGNCWMGQNLELDILSSNGEYYTGTTFDGTNYTGAEVALDQIYTKDNSGKIIKLPLNPSNTDINSTKETWSSPTRIFTTISSTRNSSEHITYSWAKDGSDGMRSYSYNASNKEWNYSTEPNASKKDAAGNYIFGDSSTGQPYARRGNLYNWTAATLGSSLKLTSAGQQAEDSICPRGWQLPLGSTLADNTATLDTIKNKTYAKLLKTYGMDLSQTDNVSNYNRVNEWPLQILRTGYYRPELGTVIVRTSETISWTGAINHATNGQYLFSWTGRLSTVHANDNGRGGSIRCVAR